MIMNCIPRMRLLVPLLIVALPGCSLGRGTPPLEQYVLGAAAPAPPTAADAEGVAVGVRRLDLASYLAQPSIVVRRGPNQIVISEFHRWGEDLDAGVNRVVARHLRATPLVRTADVAPWPMRTRHDYLLQIHLSRFEGVAVPGEMEGAVQMVAEWEIIEPGGGTVLARGRTDFRETGWTVGDYAGLVMLLDRGVSELAGDVAGCIANVVASGAEAVAVTATHPLACGPAAVRAAR
jgi:uncharacterized lipoprotein YmbA